MKVKDPVCGMEFEKFEAQAEFEIEDKDFYFCSKECRDEFCKNPKKYMKAAV